METFAGVVKNVLACGVHRDLVFSNHHLFRRWFQLVAAVKKKQNEADEVDEDISKLIFRLLFTKRASR